MLGTDVRVDRCVVAIDVDDVAGDDVMGRRVGLERGAQHLDVVAERRGHRRNVGDRREVERQRVGVDETGQFGELLQVRASHRVWWSNLSRWENKIQFVTHPGGGRDPNRPCWSDLRERG